MISIKESTGISRNLTATAGDRPVSMAMLSGQVAPGKAMTLSLLITDEALAAAHREDVAAALEDFLNDLRALALANGLPV